jgi:hypothetical protein
MLCSFWAKDRPNAAKDDSAMVERIAEIRRYGGSTIGVTGEDASDGAFHQEKPHLAKAGQGTVIVEPP